MINSEKHIVQLNVGTITGPAGILNLNLVSVLAPGVAYANPQDVEIGTEVRAVYVELWLIGSAQNVTSCQAIVYKTPADAPAIDNAEFSVLNEYANKKNIFRTFQGIVGESDSNPVPVIRDWIKIPKGKRRFGLGDKLRLTIRSIDNDTTFCGTVIYKALN